MGGMQQQPQRAQVSMHGINQVQQPNESQDNNVQMQQSNQDNFNSVYREATQINSSIQRLPNISQGSPPQNNQVYIGVNHESQGYNR